MQQDFWIRIPHFYLLEYYDRNKKMNVDIDFRESKIELEPRLITHWEPPFEEEEIPYEEKMRILRNIRTCLIQQKWSRRNVRVYKEDQPTIDSSKDAHLYRPAYFMSWKEFSRAGSSQFEIPVIPMLFKPDLVIFPPRWRWHQMCCSDPEALRQDAMSWLTSTRWRRKFRIVEGDVPLANDLYTSPDKHPASSMENKSRAYDELILKQPFHPRREHLAPFIPREKFPFTFLPKWVIKAIFIILEIIHAFRVRGEVVIPKIWLVEGSLFQKIILPILKRNKNVSLHID